MSAHVGAAHGGRWETLRVRIRRPPWPALLSLLGLMVAAAVIVAHVPDLHTLGATFRALRPWSLALALLLQAMTYVITGLVWRRALPPRSGPSLMDLASIAVSKMLADQLVPVLGLGGMMWVAHGLHRRGVPRAAASFAILVGLAGFYLAYGIALVAALLELMLRPGGAPHLSPPPWTMPRSSSRLKP